MSGQAFSGSLNSSKWDIYVTLRAGSVFECDWVNQCWSHQIGFIFVGWLAEFSYV